jgi:4'-phosphopantetheinyl transferase
MLRATLARYVGVAPDALRFGYGPVGKPYLDGPLGAGLSFSLAHAHDMALLAVTSGARVGVDVELVGDADDAAIARAFFAPEEQHALAELPPAQRRAAFYRCWVCKEAVAKARGDGLALALGRFVVSVDLAAPAALLHVDGDPDEAMRWRLITLTPTAGVVAALCCAGHADEPLRVSHMRA